MTDQMAGAPMGRGPAERDYEGERDAVNDYNAQLDDTALTIADAHRRAQRQAEAYVPIDYAGVNKLHRKQKAALTRAKNTIDEPKGVRAEAVARAVIKAVREWRAAPYNGHWPDDWATWQVALNDTLPWNQSVDLADLR